LALRARMKPGLGRSDVDRCLSEERSLVIDWLNRGTLHLVRSEDHGWLHALTAPRLEIGNMRRLAQEGVTPAQAERAVTTIEQALVDDGPQTRAQLGERIARRRVRTEGQALIHLLSLACLRGVALRGPMVGRDHAYAHARDWLGPRQEVDRDAALTELARRYLIGHGPADERDLAYWSGLPLRDARAGMRALGQRLRKREDGLFELTTRGGRRQAPEPPYPPPRLLGSFDPALHGWRSREWLLGKLDARQVITVNGIFRAFALVAGRGVGLWRIAGGAIELEPLVRVSASDRAALLADGEDVVRFLAS
ncbi:MAG TPA: winged helix DNA-binding domain-containing protein, partial [Solirubrobacteraceae bacterium]